MEVIKYLENLLKSEFFGVIKQFCGKSVMKYWLTGVLPAFRDGLSPLTTTRLISFKEEFQSLCGFTQEDVDAIVKRALRDFSEDVRISTLAYLKNWHNGYTFSPASSGSKKLTVYNPQLVFVHLENMAPGSTPLCHMNEANAVHTKTVLSLVGETGPVGISDLVDMLYSKANAHISTELSFTELMQGLDKRSEDVTWSLLYYLGIVTFCEDSDHPKDTHSLRAPNATMVQLVSPGTFVLGRVLIIDFGSRRLADASKITSMVILTTTRSCVNPTRNSCPAILPQWSNYSKTFSV